MMSSLLFRIHTYKKEGKSMEIAEIRNQLNEMQEKINSFRGSL